MNCTPSVPPAPARLSTTIVTPSASLIRCPMIRATMSTPLPGEEETIKRTCLIGKSWECVSLVVANRPKSGMTRYRTRHPKILEFIRPQSRVIITVEAVRTINFGIALTRLSADLQPTNINFYRSSYEPFFRLETHHWLVDSLH